MIKPLRKTELLPGTMQNLYYPPRDYTYFARADELPFAIGNTIVKAAWAADASMLAYGRYGATPMTKAQLDDNFGRGGMTYEMIGDWNAPGTQGNFASGRDFAMVIFRGTEKDDPHDLVSDCDIALVHEPDYRPAPEEPRPALGHLAFVMHLFSEPCMVHRGFQCALNQVWTDVHAKVASYRQTHPRAEICFTGHSLGGALALLAFSRFADQNVSLYTFGCPRVGDGAFRDRVMSNPGRGIYRFVNYDDAVTHVPLESVLYRQVPGECYRFNEDGVLDRDDGSFKGDVMSLEAAVVGLPGCMKPGDLDKVDAPPSLVDHSPARYCFRLWDCV